MSDLLALIRQAASTVADLQGQVAELVCDAIYLKYGQLSKFIFES